MSKGHQSKNRFASWPFEISIFLLPTSMTSVVEYKFQKFLKSDLDCFYKGMRGDKIWAFFTKQGGLKIEIIINVNAKIPKENDSN